MVTQAFHDFPIARREEFSLRSIFPPGSSRNPHAAGSGPFSKKYFPVAFNDCAHDVNGLFFMAKSENSF